MASVINLDRAKQILDEGLEQANQLLQDPSKIDGLLMMVEDKCREIPTIGNTLGDLPLMISMVKSYCTQEYPEVSVKVIATIVSAFIYMVKKKDLIPDNVPILGVLDDIAVIALALRICQPELLSYKLWREDKLAKAAA